MRNILCTLFFLCFYVVAQSQIREVLNEIKPKKQFAGEPVIRKRSQILQAGLSAPNQLGSFLSLGGLDNLFQSNKSSTGPFFLRYEYLIKDNIGLGASVAYATATETYNSPIGTGKVTGSISGFSILFSTYYHIYTTNKIDTYSQGSIGLNIWTGSYKDQADAEVQKFTAPTPIAYQALLGARYFFTPNINVGGELSFSNLKFTAGISAGIKLK